MIIQRITYKPYAVMEFTEEEINVLKFLSDGLLNSIQDGKAEVALHNSQVQLLCKCCEMATLCEPKIAEVGSRLHSELWRAITRLSEEWEKVNEGVGA
jgi:hypothetical protein